MGRTGEALADAADAAGCMSVATLAIPRWRLSSQRRSRMNWPVSQAKNPAALEEYTHHCME